MWDLIKGRSYNHALKTKWSDNIEQMATNNSNTIKSVVSILVFGSLVYFTWQERNKRQFTNEKRSSQELANIIMDTVKMRLIGLKVLNSANVQMVAKDWDITFKNCSKSINCVQES